MRKTGVWMLFMALLICLTACGTGEKPDAPETTAAPTVTEATVAPTQVPTETTEPEKKITFQEMTAFEDERCKIQITGLTGFDKKMGDRCIHINFENKLEDQPLYLDIDPWHNMSVNGVGFDISNGPIYLDVDADEESNEYYGDFLIPAKESANGAIRITSEQYKQICDRVGEITDIGLVLYYYHEEDSSLTASTPVFHIYPYGEENAVTAAREDLPTDKVIVDNEYARVIATGFEKDSLNLFIENKMEKSLGIEKSYGKSMINGVPIDAGYYKVFEPGMCSYSRISWWEDDLKAAGIDQLEMIDLTLRMMTFNPEERADWYEDIEVTLTP